MDRITLNQLEQGQSGKVISLSGGIGLADKLNALGIRVGKEITKVSNSFIGGPVTVQVGNSKVAIGYRMAAKIIVQKTNNA